MFWSIRKACCCTASSPEPPVTGPGPKDQVNLTDADSRIMPVAGGGFEQAYNAQALVAADSLLVVTNDVVQAPNDKRQIEPALEALARLTAASMGGMFKGATGRVDIEV